MKILLIFPPQNLNERYARNMGNVGGFLPPLGLCYMAAVLERDGHEVRIMDCPVNNYTISDILTEITNFDPKAIGIAAITSLANVTKELCDVIKNQFPDKFIILGGPHPTVMPNEVSQEINADIVIQGEADNIISDVLKNLEEYQNKRIIKAGIVMKLDELPLPARHLLDMSKYTSLPNTYKKSANTFQMVTSRGCPFTCTFCHDAKGVFRQRSVENVIKEIKHLQEKYDVKEIAFWDDIITLNKAWMHKFCEALDKERIGLIWSCYTRLDLVDEPLLRSMKKAGCWNIFFGIEAGSQELLDNMKKKMTIEQMANQVRLVKKIGIEIRGSFMIGLPGETPEKARETIKYAIDLDPDYAQFTITTPYPGTELWNTAEQWGTLNKDFRNFNEWQPVFIPKGYKNADELLQMHKEAFRRFYFRPKFILKKIAKIKSFSELGRHLKGLRVVYAMASGT
ncbi:MAG: radical SAM protein [Nanoarchaeota archaeon]